MKDDKTYTCLAEYFEDHPEEESGYYDDMAEMQDEVLDYPEDWSVQ